MHEEDWSLADINHFTSRASLKKTPPKLSTGTMADYADNERMVAAIAAGRFDGSHDIGVRKPGSEEWESIEPIEACDLAASWKKRAVSVTPAPVKGYDFWLIEKTPGVPNGEALHAMAIAEHEMRACFEYAKGNLSPVPKDASTKARVWMWQKDILNAHVARYEAGSGARAVAADELREKIRRDLANPAPGSKEHQLFCAAKVGSDFRKIKEPEAKWRKSSSAAVIKQLRDPDWKILFLDEREAKDGEDPHWVQVTFIPRERRPLGDIVRVVFVFDSPPLAVVVEQATLAQSTQQAKTPKASIKTRKDTI